MRNTRKYILFSDAHWHDLPVKVKRRVIAILLGCALAGAVVALFWPRGPKEPEYEGKKLSEWTIALSLTPSQRPSQAVRHIGTNALPWLLRCIAYERPNWKSTIMSVLPGPRRGPLGRLWIYLNLPDQRAAQAALALKILGAEGESAVPALGAILENAHGSEKSSRLMSTLFHLESAGADISLAIPSMLLVANQMRQNPNSVGLQSQKGIFLSFVRYPSTCLDPLKNCLSDPRQGVRLGAIYTLGLASERGDCSDEILRPALQDADAEVRRQATNVMVMLKTKTLGESMFKLR